MYSGLAHDDAVIMKGVNKEKEDKDNGKRKVKTLSNRPTAHQHGCAVACAALLADALSRIPSGSSARGSLSGSISLPLLFQVLALDNLPRLNTKGTVSFGLLCQNSAL